jgi:hypothetical protein
MGTSMGSEKTSTGDQEDRHHHGSSEAILDHQRRDLDEYGDAAQAGGAQAQPKQPGATGTERADPHQETARARPLA